MTPMMCARLAGYDPKEKHNFLYRWSGDSVEWLRRGYARSLAWILNHQPLTLAVTLCTVALSVYLYIIVPKGFFPQQDVGRLSGTIIADQATSFQAMQERVTQLLKVCMDDPAVDSLNAYIGVGGGGGGSALNQGRLNVTLKPLAERKMSSDEVIARLRPKLSRIPGVSLYLQAVQDLRIGGLPSGAQYQYTLQSDTVPELNEWAPRVFQKLRATLPQLADVNSDQQDRGLQAALAVDRVTASRMGISMQAIDNTLYDAFGQRQVSVIYTQLNQYHVVMEVDPIFWQNPDGLKSLYVNGSGGAQVPLSAFTSYAPGNTALGVNHQGLIPFGYHLVQSASGYFAQPGGPCDRAGGTRNRTAFYRSTGASRARHRLIRTRWPASRSSFWLRS